MRTGGGARTGEMRSARQFTKHSYAQLLLCAVWLLVSKQGPLWASAVSAAQACATCADGAPRWCDDGRGCREAPLIRGGGAESSGGGGGGGGGDLCGSGSSAPSPFEDLEQIRG